MQREPDKGTFSGDIIRIPQDFYLWEAVRASTAAPTFFPSKTRFRHGRTCKPGELGQMCG